MSLINQLNEKRYTQINDDFLEGKGTMEYCCNINGITKSTYYRIKKRFESSEKPQSKKSDSLFSRKITPMKISDKKDMAKVIKNSEIELTSSKKLKNQLKKKPVKKHKKISEDDNIDDINDIDELADFAIKRWNFNI